MNKQWKQWVIFVTGLVIVVRGFIGDPSWYVLIGLVLATLSLWTIIEKKA